jgi:hypothetical protein
LPIDWPVRSRARKSGIRGQYVAERIVISDTNRYAADLFLSEAAPFTTARIKTVPAILGENEQY